MCDLSFSSRRRLGIGARLILAAGTVCALAATAGCGSPGTVSGAGENPDAETVVVRLDAPLVNPPLDSGTFEGGAIDGPPGSCGASPFSASNRPVNVLLVIDRSGSMTDPYGSGQSKWTALELALGSVLEAQKQSIAFGLELFPYSDDPNPGKCALPQGSAAIEVPVGPGETTAPQVLARLAKAPAGGTPTAAALANAFEYFTNGDGRLLAGDKYVLLATDGGPNCNASHAPCGASTCTTNLDGQCPVYDGGAPVNCCDLPANLGVSFCIDDQETTSQLAKLLAAGIKTFVVGLPGTDVYSSYLDGFAAAGGGVNPHAPPLYFNVDPSGGVAGLAAVFSSITTQLITTCQFQLAAVPPDVSLLNVEIDGQTIPQAGPDGWEVSSGTNPPTVILKGATCTRVQTQGASSVQIVYGCPTVIIP